MRARLAVPNDDQLKQLCNSLNELGRRTLEYGIRLAPHPHIWGPLEREAEIRRVMELTDPKYVWLTADTGHLTLGSADAVQMVSDYFPRIAEIHMKDTYAKFRGNKQTPTPEMHKEASVYHNFGGGGVELCRPLQGAARQALQGLGGDGRGRSAQGR